MPKAPLKRAESVMKRIIAGVDVSAVSPEVIARAKELRQEHRDLKRDVLVEQVGIVPSGDRERALRSEHAEHAGQTRHPARSARAAREAKVALTE